MKKKLLSFVLVAIMCFGSTVNAHATTTTNPTNTSSMNQESATVNVSYEVQSSYSVNIPAEIRIDGTHNFKMTASSMNLKKGQRLHVSVDSNEIMLTNEFGDQGRLTISSDLTDTAPTILAYFEARQLETEQTITLMPGSPTEAGIYSGTLTFNFYIL